MAAKKDLVSRVMAEMGRRGGHARAKALTAKQRRDSAIKASLAAAKARSEKALERRRRMTKFLPQRPKRVPPTRPELTNPWIEVLRGTAWFEDWNRHLTDRKRLIEPHLSPRDLNPLIK